MNLIAEQTPSYPKRIYRTVGEKRRVVERIIGRPFKRGAGRTPRKASTPTNFIAGGESIRQDCFHLAMPSRVTYYLFRSRARPSNRSRLLSVQKPQSTLRQQKFLALFASRLNRHARRSPQSTEPIHPCFVLRWRHSAGDRTSPGTHIWIAAGVTDMRRGFQGLSAQVQLQLQLQPLSGHVFVFRGRARRHHQDSLV